MTIPEEKSVVDTYMEAWPIMEKKQSSMVTVHLYAQEVKFPR